MIQENVTIVSHSEIIEDIFRISLAYPSRQGAANPYRNVIPGQFMNLYLRDRSMLLPRPISICSWKEEGIDLVYRVAGKGTRELSGYKEGESLRVSTPLGNGYDVDAVFGTLSSVPSDQKIIALVAGGLGVPPMVQLAKTIRRKLTSGNSELKGVRTTEDTKLVAVLGFREATFLTEELGSFCDEIYIATENGADGFRGNVLDMLKDKAIQADYYLSCGPRPMLKELAGICAGLNHPLQVSMEERMGCGYGACVGCTCKTMEVEDSIMKVKQKKVCKDGPVFLGSEVIWDE